MVKSRSEEKDIGVLLKIISPALIIKIEIIIALAERFMMETLKMPRLIMGSIDLLNLFLVLCLLRNKEWKKYKELVISYLVILVVSLVVGIINYEKWNGNIVYSCIEFRNIIRFPVFFIACATFLNHDDVKFIYKVLVIFFLVNSLVILYQYFTYHPNIGSRGDHLNGLFGHESGGNAFVNVIMLVVLAYLLSSWRDKNVSTVFFFVAVGISLLIAALIELKAFFFEILLIYGWYFVSCKKSKKELLLNLILIIGAVIVSAIGLSIMYKEYPGFKGYVSIEGLKDQLFGNGYTGKGDLNRFTGIFTIASDFFAYNISEILFGIGLGNACQSSIVGSATLFYNTYGESNYKLFLATHLFIQTGALGFILYLSTYVYLFFKKKENLEFKLNTQIMCLIAVLLVFYNDTFLTDAGYFIYFALASGFVKKKDAIENFGSI